MLQDKYPTGSEINMNMKKGVNFQGISFCEELESNYSKGVCKAIPRSSDFL